MNFYPNPYLNKNNVFSERDLKLAIKFLNEICEENSSLRDESYFEGYINNLNSSVTEIESSLSELMRKRQDTLESIKVFSEKEEVYFELKLNQLDEAIEVEQKSLERLKKFIDRLKETQEKLFSKQPKQGSSAENIEPKQKQPGEEA